MFNFSPTIVYVTDVVNIGRFYIPSLSTSYGTTGITITMVAEGYGVGNTPTDFFNIVLSARYRSNTLSWYTIQSNAWGQINSGIACWFAME